MSKKRMSDCDRTRILVELVRQIREPEYGARSLSTVVLEEVAQGTGFVASRADVLALGVWQGTGRRLDGYEIKASRGDLRKELSDPAKSEAVARYCDTWTLVAWDESVLVDGIPEAWGITYGQANGFGEVELIVKRKPTRRTPDAWPRDFVCSLVRNAYEQSPSAAFVSRAVVAANTQSRHEHERSEQRARKEAVRKALEPLYRHYYGKDEWSWNRQKTTDEELIARALADLQQGILGKQGAA